ncbi:hypothetical protein [Micromonospora arborensis]|uniref:hypothetical protein n=1 Tax=Micromonospora arborensis TaxID=2116518 RepID=UPI003716EE66
MAERREPQQGRAGSGAEVRDKLGTFKLPRIEWDLFGANAEALRTDRSAELLNFVRWANRDPRASAPRRPDLSAPTPSADTDVPATQLGTFRLPAAEWEALGTTSKALESNRSAELLNFVRWFNRDPAARRPRRSPTSRVAAGGGVRRTSRRRATPETPAAPEETKDQLGTFRLPKTEWRTFAASTQQLRSDRSAELLNLVRWVNHDPRGKAPRRPQTPPESS